MGLDDEESEEEAVEEDNTSTPVLIREAMQARSCFTSINF
jgi:hypothetical protein